MPQFAEDPNILALEEALAYLLEQDRHLKDVILYAEAAQRSPLTETQMSDLISLVKAAQQSKEKAAEFLRFLRAKDSKAALKHPLPSS